MSVTVDQPLYPPAMRGTDKDLSDGARKRILKLTRPAPIAWLVEATILWASIAAFIALAEWAEHWAVTVLVVFLIGTRQLALGYLVHEQAHHSAFRFKGGDLVANFLAAYPLLVVLVEKYAQVHLSHHQHYFTDRDPDFLRKRGEVWTYPQPGWQVVRTFARELSGLNLVKLVRGKKMDGAPYKRLMDIPGWVRLAYYCVWAAVFTLFGIWVEFLLYWILPIATVLQACLRWTAICEHEYGIEHARLEDTTPIIMLPTWQKLLLPDVNFGLHVYHHYFPAIPFNRLPEAHRIFVEDGLVDESRVYYGYGSVLRRAVSSSSTSKVVRHPASGVAD